MTTEAGAEHLLSEAYESEVASVRWAERRGYRAAGVTGWAMLELGEDRGGPEPMVPAAGTELLSLRSVAGRPDRDQLFHAMHRTMESSRADIPAPLPLPGQTFDEFRATLGDGVLDECSFVALVENQVAGYTLCARRGSSEATTTMTVVGRAHRGRGLATTLKSASIAQARAMGLRRLWTMNDRPNQPMRAVNRRLGYIELPGRVLLIKPA